MTPHEAPLVFTQGWERFLDKLSVPVTESCYRQEHSVRYLPALAVSMHTEPPRTLIHNDVQGNNLLVAEDGEVACGCRLAADDRRPARPRLARFIVGYLHTAGRRRHEDRLLQIYHSV